MTAWLLQPWVTEGQTVTPADLLGKPKSLETENAAVAGLLGLPAPEGGYEQVMAKIAARRLEESDGGHR